MPAKTKHSPRRRLRLKKKTELSKANNKSALKKFFFLFIIPIVFTYFLISSTTHLWLGSQKLAIAGFEENGAKIVVYDPKMGSVTTINIPGSVEVDAARNLGKWRLKNLEKLGKKEGVGSKLLTETLAKYFKFPVAGYIDEVGVKEMFVPSNHTNLGFGDKLRLLYFNIKTPSEKSNTINLEKTRYLKKAILSDGEEGYVLTGSIPGNIAAIFSEPDFTAHSGKTKIVDYTEEFLAQEVAPTIEVLGLKTLMIESLDKKDIDCVVESKKKEVGMLVSRIFSCNLVVKKDLEYDVVISLGTQFAKRY